MPSYILSSSSNASPSFARRQHLKEAGTNNQIQVLDSCPLSNYTKIAQRLFVQFEEEYEKLNLDEAYVYGIRFAQLVLKSLPEHPEWKNTGGIDKNTILKLQISNVLSRLEIIVRKMDEEESKNFIRTSIKAQTNKTDEIRMRAESDSSTVLSQESYDDDDSKHGVEDTVAEMVETKSTTKSNFLSASKKATSSFRNLFGSLSRSQVDDESSQAAVPSLDTIRLSRADQFLK